MEPSELELLKELFYEAIQQSPERRVEFLAQACGSSENLRTELTRLLAEHDCAVGFLESPFGSGIPVRYLADRNAILEPNRIIAHRYRVVSLLGEGGMGVVYKAEDTRLPRFVALKSIGGAFAGDADSLARLRREAQTASTLNHPNICTIHDVVESDGQTYIVMEFLDGQTLKEMIRGDGLNRPGNKAERHALPVPIDNLLKIAAQIIEGLQTAHEKGIVHRDIKPANIFVTRTGHVKILDFGIAKMTQAAEDVGGPGEVPLNSNFQSSLTTTGVAAGTVGYMSPEQLSAKQLDARTDLFSFGAVLYEMATGRMPYRGENTNLVVGAILNEVVVPAVQVNPNITPKLGRIIEKCLQKDRGLRYQSAADVSVDLKQLRHEMDVIRGTKMPLRDEAPVPASVPEVSHYSTERPNPHMDPRAVHGIVLPLPPRGLLIAACAILISGGVLAFMFRPALQSPRITGSVQLTHDGRDKERVVTDGIHVYYSSYPDLSARLYRVPVSGGDTVQVETSIPGPYVFDVSPGDSELLVGGCKAGQPTADCPLWILPLRGGSPRRLGDTSGSDAAWSPDGRRVVYVQQNKLYEFEVVGSESKEVVSMSAGETISWPRWSPDGSRLRFTVTQSNGTSLWEVSEDGKNLHSLLPGWNTPPSECCGSWTPDGRYFLFQSDRGGSTNIWAVREGGGILRKANHEAVQLTAGPTSAETAVPSPDNKKLLVTTARSGELVRYDSASREFASFLSGISATGVDFSRDGQWITYVTYPEHTLWRSRVDGSERLQLTYLPLYALQPRWSPDGTRIAFAALEADRPWSIYVISASGGSLEQPVPGDHRGIDPNWSPDGNKLLFGYRPEDAGTLELKTVDLRSHVVSKVAGSEEMWSPRWSRDGRHIVAFPRATDRLMQFDVNSQKWSEIARIHASYPEWSRNSDYIYFLAQSKGEPATVIYRVRISDRHVEQVVSLRGFQQPTVDWGGWAALSPDDSPILLREAGTPEIFSLSWDAP